jgi:putative MATE family efflux protein
MHMKDSFGLRSQPLQPLLFKMIVANSIGVLATLSFGLVDTYFVSILGTAALSAINFTHPITLLFIACTTGIAIAFGTHLSFVLATAPSPSSQSLWMHTLLGSLGLTIIWSGFCYVSADWIIHRLGASASVQDQALSYLHAWLRGTPLLMGAILGQQALKSIGDTKANAWLCCFTAALNALFDALFILGWGSWEGYGIEGAAYASCLAWSIHICLLGWRLHSKHRLFLPLHQMQRTLFNTHWRQLLTIASPATMTMILNPISHAILIAMLADQGEVAMIAYGTGAQIQSFCILGVTAVSAAVMPFIAQNLSVQQNHRAYVGFQTGLRWLLAWQGLIFIGMHLNSHTIAAWFTQDPAVMPWLTFYLEWVSLGFVPLAMTILIVNALHAYQQSKLALRINFIRSVFVMIPLAYLGQHYYGAIGIFMAPLITNFGVGMICCVLSLQLQWPSKRHWAVN